MNKTLDRINLIVIIFIIVISIITIFNNFKKVLQSKYYLEIDSNNRTYVEELISENYELKGNLNKVAYKQGLGDWYLFLYYEDGTEDKTIFGDSDIKIQPLQKYIVENGYDESIEYMVKIRISYWAIFLSIIYEICYLVIKKIKMKKNT